MEYPEPIYVSRDEEFEEGKNEMLSDGAIKALLHNFMPLLVSSVSPDIRDFAGFHDVDNLFKEGLRLKQALQDQLFQKIPFVRKIQENSEGLLRYDTPDIIKSKQWRPPPSMVHGDSIRYDTKHDDNGVLMLSSGFFSVWQRTSLRGSATTSSRGRRWLASTPSTSSVFRYTFQSHKPNTPRTLRMPPVAVKTPPCRA